MLTRNVLLFFFTLSMMTGFINGKLLASSDEQHWHNFYLVTIPKSGSHLMHKFMKMLLDASPKDPQVPNHDNFTFPNDQPEVLASTFADAVLKINDGKLYPSSHTNFTEFYLRFSETYPDYVPIILVRDLRDVLVSCVYFQWELLEKEIGPSTFDQKLSFLIHLGYSKPRKKIINVYRYAEEALPWLHHPKAVVIRFEELVGEQGGGSLELQKMTIAKLANALEVPLDSDRLTLVAQELFGKDLGPQLGPQLRTTFREGKIGSWKTHFNEENLTAFNEKWGHYQKALGYST